MCIRLRLLDIQPYYLLPISSQIWDWDIDDQFLFIVMTNTMTYFWYDSYSSYKASSMVSIMVRILSCGGCYFNVTKFDIRCCLNYTVLQLRAELSERNFGTFVTFNHFQSDVSRCFSQFHAMEGVFHCGGIVIESVILKCTIPHGINVVEVTDGGAA